MPDPAPTAAPVAPAASPPSVPTAVRVLDQLGDLAGVLCVTYLASRGLLPGTEAVFTILAILGVQTGIRTIGAGIAQRAGAVVSPGAGAAALVFMAVVGALARAFGTPGGVA